MLEKIGRYVNSSDLSTFDFQISRENSEPISNRVIYRGRDSYVVTGQNKIENKVI